MNLFKKLFGKNNQAKPIVSSNQDAPSKTGANNSHEDYNIKFDQVLSEIESNYKREFINDENEDISEDKSELIYNTDIKYDRKFFTSEICSLKFSEANKIDFIEKSIRDGNDEYLHRAFRYTSETFQKQPRLAQRIQEFLKQKDETDEQMEFKEINFAMKNNLDSAKVLIDQYLQKRSSEYRYRAETEIPEKLFKLGFEHESLELLALFVQEQKEGKITYLHDGHHDNKGNVFALHYFLGNPDKRQEVLDLAFSYFENITLGYTYSLGQFLQSADFQRYRESIKLWIEKYPTLDQDNSSNVNGYKSLLTGKGKCVAEELGWQYWEKFLATKELWESYDFESCLVEVGEFVMSPKLSKDEQKKIIDYVVSNTRALRADDDYTYSRVFQQYIKMILKTKESMSKEEILKYVPEKYNKYGTWEYVLRDIEQSGAQKLDYKKTRNEFVKAGFLAPQELDPYDDFINEIGYHSVQSFLHQTGRCIHFDAEAGMIPVDHKELFNDTFLPVIKENGIENIEFAETQLLEENNCTYTLSCKIGDHAYSKSFDEFSDWFNVQHMVTVINLCLRKSDSKLRLVSIDTGDQTAMLGFFEPNQIMPFIWNYGIRTWAREEDKIFEYNYC